MDENTREEFKSCDCSKDKWIKFGLIVLAVFLGCYLATYYLLDQMRHHYYYAPVRPIHNIDNVIQQQDKMFDEMESLPVDVNSLLPTNAPVIQTFKKDDAYKVIVDLKPFDGEVSNIKTEIKPNRISIFGQKFTTKKHGESDYEFSQSFVLPERIDVKDVKKEKVKDKYIITLPIKD